MGEASFELEDVEHGRTWVMTTHRTVVGFSWDVFIDPLPSRLAGGWIEGDLELTGPALLAGIMLASGATPRALPEGAHALRRLLDTAQTQMVRECQDVAEAIETGRVTTTHTISQALQAIADGRA